MASNGFRSLVSIFKKDEKQNIIIMGNDNQDINLGNLVDYFNNGDDLVILLLCLTLKIQCNLPSVEYIVGDHRFVITEQNPTNSSTDRTVEIANGNYFKLIITHNGVMIRVFSSPDGLNWYL